MTAARHVAGEGPPGKVERHPGFPTGATPEQPHGDATNDTSVDCGTTGRQADEPDQRESLNPTPGWVQISAEEWARLHQLDLADRRRQRRRELRKTTAPNTIEAVLRQIRGLHQQPGRLPSDYEPIKVAVDNVQADTVDRLMREDLWSWREVGDALGISAQAAQKRFSRRSVKGHRRVGGQPARLR